MVYAWDGLAFSIVQSSSRSRALLYSTQIHTPPTMHPPYNSQKSSPNSIKPKQPPHPHPHPLPTIQLRPHIQIKAQPRTFPRTPPSPIKINHILHLPPLPPTPLHHPIMPVKRPLIPQPPVHPRPRRQRLTVPSKTPQPRPAAAGVCGAQTGGGGFPGFDQRPGALVDGVVDGHDGAHVGGGGGVRFARHGVEEHFFRGVDPVC